MTVGRCAVRSAFGLVFAQRHLTAIAPTLAQFSKKNMPLNLNTGPGPRSSPISYAEERKTYPDSLSAQIADSFRQDFKI